MNRYRWDKSRISFWNGRLSFWMNPSWRNFWFFRFDMSYFKMTGSERWSARIGRFVMVVEPKPLYHNFLEVFQNWEV